MEYKVYETPEILKNERLLVLDIETTGLNILLNTIIELGTVEVKDGIITKEYSRLFGGGRSSMYLVRKIHKIKDAERVGKPTFKEVGHKVASYLSNAVIVTHNGNRFDIPMLNQKLSEVGEKIENSRFIDTYVIAKNIGHESNSLENLAKEYNLQYGQHRGLGDAHTTLQLLFAMVNKHGDKIVL